MQFKLNPITGDIDRVSGNGNYIQKINPVTGKFNLVDDANSYKQIINPLTGNFQLWPLVSGIIAEVTGNGYINLTNAVAHHLMELKAYGGTEQDLTPTPDTPVDIVCNNGVLKYGVIGKNLFNKDDDTNWGGWYSYNNAIAESSSANKTVVMRCLPSTTYYFKHCTYAGGLRAFYTEEGNWTIGSSCSTAVGTTSNVANTVYSITTSANAKWLFLCVGRNDSSTTATFEQQISDYILSTEELTSDTPYEPYQAGIYADGTTETIKAIGKNLFDTQWQAGIYSTATGEYSPAANRISNVNMIQVKPSTSYAVSCPSYELGAGMRWLFYDENKNFISAITNGATTITTPSNAKYINFYIANNLTVDTAPDLQLEQGSTATDYEAYYNGGTATAEMLLKVGNYQDTQEVISGAVSRNIGITVLNGTEGWGLQSNQTSIFYCVTTDEAVSGSEAICSHYTGVATNVPFSYMTNNTIKHGHGTNNSRIYIKDTRFTTASELKQFLADQYAAGTPVMIVYPLENPTTETVTGQPMNIQTGTNTIEITQASIDNLPLYAKYLSTN